jgi:ribosomal protein L37E
LQESLPPEVQGVNHIDNDNEIEQLYDPFQMEDDDDHEIDKIVDHVFKDGILILKVRYQGETKGEHVLEVPFGVLKKDIPLELAKYVQDHVLDEKRNGHYNQWAKKTIQTHGRCVRCLYRSYNIDKTIRANQTRQARNAKIQDRVKYDIRVLRNTREALLLDKQNKNTKWADAIAKEMTALNRLDVFEYKSPSHACNESDGWHFAPMHMIVDIKQQDLQHKARLVCGGHVIDLLGHVTYSSTIKDISVQL